MKYKKIKTLGIIGLGNVGLTVAKYLLLYFNQHNIHLEWVCSKSQKNNDLLLQNDIPQYSDISSISSVPDAIIICVNDNNIDVVSQELVNHFAKKITNTYVIHTAGVLGIDILEKCIEVGCIPIAAHPFQTFSSKSPTCLLNIVWGIETKDKSDELTAAITDFFINLNGKPLLLPKEVCNKKELYHIIGVATSNYMTAAIKYGILIADYMQLNKKDLLIPIITQTLHNCIDAIEKDEQIPLSGPIVRNDTTTIEKHLVALNNLPVFKDIYLDFAKITTNLNNMNKF